ncbi:MAG: hypothetical protein OXQ89_15675 [Rhodospirillaceae bacterium]|nr:hypothetical protein [Rhodospirillaceae bacterium]
MRVSQAHFTEAPRLDEIEIVELSNYKIRISLQTLKFQFKGNREKAAKFRALRRLAVQGFDQSQAEEFHRAELISERGVVDKYWSVSFILSLLYELFSDFGRSFWMPLTWWMAFAGAFTLLYVEFADTSCNCSRVSIYKAAMGLSLHQNLGPISNFDDKLPIWYERLYGSNVAPSKVLSLGIVQTMISASLIFFFLLAVRRRFRLKQ